MLEIIFLEILRLSKISPIHFLLLLLYARVVKWLLVFCAEIGFYNKNLRYSIYKD